MTATTNHPRATGEPAPQTSRRQWALRTGIGIVVVLLLGVLGAGWYYADEILRVEDPAPQGGDVEVLTVDPAENVVRLTRTPASVRPGVWGLRGPKWYAQVGAIVAEDAESVSRRLLPLSDLPLAGESALVDGYAYPGDPEVLPFAVESVSVPGPLGEYPALHLPGASSTWMILVHGRGAGLGETFRMLPIAAERDLPALVVSYRNDQGAPPAPDGRYGMGWTEADDVEAAIDWAAGQGAEDVVLVGYSMGGAVVGNVERRHDGVPLRGMILDAPVLDWDLPLQAAARERGVPTALTPVAQALVSVRTGLRWDALSLLDRAAELDVPLLVIHGTADDVVPIEGSDALAAARPDLVTYLRVPGAGHVQAWNVDPQAYERAVDAFLSRLGL